MSTVKTLLFSGITAVSMWSLPAGGQSGLATPYLTPSGQPAVILPASDLLNKGNWAVDASLSDEFNGTQLDPTKWRRGILGWLGRPPALFVDHDVTMTAGALQITMQKEPVDDQYAALGFHDYTTGAVESIQSVLYGYFEVRARAMKSAGSSAFWLSSKDNDNSNEIDIAEMGGRPPADPREVFLSVHVFEQDGVTVTQNDTVPEVVWPAVADGFHVYGLLWTPASIDFYIDGSLRQHLENTAWHTPANIILDAETQPDWWGMPLDSDLPSVFTIDYVHVWKLAAQATEPASVSP